MLGLLLLRVLRLWRRIGAQVFTRFAKGAFYNFGSNSILIPPLRLHGEQFIQLGHNVVIGSNSWLEVLRGASKGAPVITIGDGVSSAGYLTVTAVEGVVIERNVLLARYVYISDHSHAFDATDRPIKDQGLTRIAPVRICEGAWLGQSVVICPGVTVGRNAIIGANSVVRKDVPDFCVAAGAPATIIRRIGAQTSG